MYNKRVNRIGTVVRKIGSEVILLSNRGKDTTVKSLDIVILDEESFSIV